MWYFLFGNSPAKRNPFLARNKRISLQGYSPFILFIKYPFVLGALNNNNCKFFPCL